MRTFIAIDLDEGIRRRLVDVQERLRGVAPRVRWVRPEGLHVTLKFLGEIDEEMVEPVTAVVAEAAEGIAPFQVRVAGLGAFPPRGAPRVLWAGVDDPAGQLATIHRRIDRGLAPLGFERERRRFHPHVTLGRAKDRRADPGLRTTLDGLCDHELGVQAVAEIVLFHSILDPTGAVHNPLRRHPLGRGAATE